MQPYPLTRARFLVAAIARSNDNPFVQVDVDLIDYWCAWASATVQSAMADRITPPLLEWDECLEGHAVSLAWRHIMAARGYIKEKGRDSQIDVLATQADEYLSRLRPGNPYGKSENPVFLDSGGNKPQDSIRVVSGRTSDAFLLKNCRRCC